MDAVTYHGSRKQCVNRESPHTLEASLRVSPSLDPQLHSLCVGVFDLRVRLAAGAVAPLRPRVGDGAKSAIWAHSASRHT